MINRVKGNFDLIVYIWLNIAYNNIIAKKLYAFLRILPNKELESVDSIIIIIGGPEYFFVKNLRYWSAFDFEKVITGSLWAAVGFELMHSGADMLLLVYHWEFLVGYDNEWFSIIIRSWNLLPL